MKKSSMLRNSAIIALAVLLSMHMLLELMMGYVFRELAPPIVIYVVLLSLLLSAAAFRYGRNAAGAQRTVSWVFAALLAGMVLHIGIDLLTQGSHTHNGSLICAFCGRETVSYYVLPLGVVAIIGLGLRIRKTVGTPEKTEPGGTCLCWALWSGTWRFCLQEASRSGALTTLRSCFITFRCWWRGIASCCLARRYLKALARKSSNFLLEKMRTAGMAVRTDIGM